MTGTMCWFWPLFVVSLFVSWNPHPFSCIFDTEVVRRALVLWRSSPQHRSTKRQNRRSIVMFWSWMFQFIILQKWFKLWLEALLEMREIYEKKQVLELYDFFLAFLLACIFLHFYSVVAFFCIFFCMFFFFLSCEFPRISSLPHTPPKRFPFPIPTLIALKWTPQKHLPFITPSDSSSTHGKMEMTTSLGRCYFLLAASSVSWASTLAIRNRWGVTQWKV